MHLIFFALLISLPVFAAAESVPLEPEHWQRSDRIQFSNYLGREAMMLSGGVYAATNTEIANGRVSMDVAMHGQRGFIGIVFRHQSNGDYELVYLRPHKSRLPDAIQYTPAINGMTGWQLYSENYTTAAELPHNRWMNVTVEFMDRTASVFIDEKPDPVMTVDLKSPNRTGAIGVWGRNVAHISNVTWTAFDNDEVTALPTFDAPADIIDDWEVSRVFESSSQPHDEIPDGIEWQPVTLESPGIVNISRYHQKISNARNLVFARTTIRSEGDQLTPLAIGYSDEVTVFINGQPFWHGRSAFNHRSPFALGILGFDNDILYVPLKRGDNEVVLAVGEVFGGWGFGIKRLD